MATSRLSRGGNKVGARGDLIFGMEGRENKNSEQMRLLNALCLFVEMTGRQADGRPAQAASA